MDQEKTNAELLEEIRELRTRLDELGTHEKTLSSLRAAEELNRRIIEAVPGGIVHVAANGAILKANAEALRILGLSYDALTQRYTADFATETIWEDGSRCGLDDYPVTKALVTGRAQPRATIGVRHENGEISWAIFTAVPVLETPGGIASGVVVTFVDITDRRKADAALRESEAQLRSILDSAPNWVVAADLAGKILFVNRPWLGVTREQVIGRMLWEFVVVEQRDGIREMVERVGRTGTIEAFEMTGVSGKRYSVCSGPVHYGNEVVGVTSIVEDVTGKKDLEARVAVSDRMASIGTLAAGVAHEINNPLTYVLASLEFLQRKLAADGVQPADIASMRGWALDALDGSERIRAIVRDLSTFSHVSEPPSEEIDVRPILESAIRMADSQLKFRARLVRDYHVVPRVHASSSRLSQVFLNLLVNAAQAIPEGRIESHEIRVSTGVDESDRVIIEVSDSGVGVSPEMLGKIFEPFVTTKPLGVGTGLGLYICRNIVVALGGEITALRNSIRGTTVRVALPAAKAAIRQRAGVEVPAQQITQQRMRILVVDDEPQIVFTLRAFLSDHEVTVAHSGRQAIEIWASKEFDVVFSDLVMPDLTGMDVFDRIAEIRPGHQSRIVFMTGGVFTERARAFLDGLANPVLYKPFNASGLLATLARFSTPGNTTAAG